MIRLSLLRTSLPLLIAAIIFAGCEPKKHNSKKINDLMAQFRGQEQIELLTIEPEQGGASANIYGYTILDSRIIEQESDREALLDALEAAAKAGGPGEKPECFFPRHALRLPDNPETNILICFQCQDSMYSYEGGGGNMDIADRGGSYSAVFNKYVEELGMTTGDLYLPEGDTNP